MNSAKHSSKNYKVKKGRLFILLAVLVILLVGASVAYMQIFSTKPNDAQNTQTQVFEIPSGATTKSIASALAEDGLIRSEMAFTHYVKKSGNDGKLRSGSFELSPSMSIEEITEEILNGIGEVKKFTIPEGYTLKDIAQVFVQAEIMTEEEFWQLVTSEPFSEYEFLAGLEANEHRLEGYLFPDTYIIGVNSKPREVICAMLDRFAEVMELLPENESGLSTKEMVILASLVESEAKLDSERANIASVYLNRLDRGMALQCDATVLYALPERKDVVLYSDLEYDSPYNTYKYPGLPPTPICNPGLKSLESACQPADTDYLYYLWSKDESIGHVFANDYAGHLENRKKYGY